jgi:hypothetical protein
MSTGNLFKKIYGDVRELGSLYLTKSTIALKSAGIFPRSPHQPFSLRQAFFAEKFHNRVLAKLSIIKFQWVKRENSFGLKKLLILNLILYSIRREVY